MLNIYNNINTSLGVVHKRRPQSRGRVSGADIFWTRGILQIRTSAHCGANISYFLKFMLCVRTDKGKGGQAISADEGRSIFRNFVRTSFMDGPYNNINVVTKIKQYCTLKQSYTSTNSASTIKITLDK